MFNNNDIVELETGEYGEGDYLGKLIYDDFNCDDKQNPLHGIITWIKQGSIQQAILRAALKKGCMGESNKIVMLHPSEVGDDMTMSLFLEQIKFLWNKQMYFNSRLRRIVDTYMTNAPEQAIVLTFNLNWRDVCEFVHADMEKQHLNRQIELECDKATGIYF